MPLTAEPLGEQGAVQALGLEEASGGGPSQTWNQPDLASPLIQSSLTPHGAPPPPHIRPLSPRPSPTPQSPLPISHLDGGTRQEWVPCFFPLLNYKQHEIAQK